MHTVIATDGALEAARTARVVARLYESGDEVTLITVVNFPRDFLHGFAEASGVTEVAKIADEVGPSLLGFASGAKAAERLAATTAAPPPVADDRFERYFDATAQERFKELLAALERAGIKATTHWAATEGHTARTLLDQVDELNGDLLIIGSHGRGRFEGLLGATGTKIIRRAPIDVLVIRGGPKS